MGRIPKYSRRQLLDFKCSLIRTYNTFFKINNLHQQGRILLAAMVVCRSEAQAFPIIFILWKPCSLRMQHHLGGLTLCRHWVYVSCVPRLRLWRRTRVQDFTKSSAHRQAQHAAHSTLHTVLPRSDSAGLSLWHALSKPTNSGAAPLALAADRLCCREQSTSWQVYFIVFLERNGTSPHLKC